MSKIRDSESIIEELENCFVRHDEYILNLLAELKRSQQEEIKKLQMCGICQHAKSTSIDHLRCYGRKTPYLPVSNSFTCDNFKALKE